MSSKNKVTLTNKQRREIIEFKNQNPNTSHVELVQWVKKEYNLEVHPSTISRIIKNKEDIGENPMKKRQKNVQFPNLENALHEWVLRSQENIPITDAILVEKAKGFAKILNIPDSSLKFSNGWLAKFKKRNNIMHRTKHGEEASADHIAITFAIPQLRELLEGYELKDIYNMDET
ncbi:24471_t:CDS:1, partial [Gigaspora rosea]